MIQKISFTALIIIPLLVLSPIYTKEDPPIKKGFLDCKIYLSDSKLFFNLGDLQSKENHKVSLEYPSKEGEMVKGDFAFNFCTQALKPIPQCITDLGTFGYLYYVDECMPTTSVKSSWKYSKYIDGDNQGLSAYADNSKEEGTLPFDLKYNIICQDEGSISMEAKYVKNDDPEGRNYVELTIRDPSGCSRDFSKLVNFIDDNPWVFGILFTVFGIFMTYFGFKFLRYCLATIGFTLGFLGSLLVTLWFWNYKAATDLQIFFVVVLALLLGILFCYLFYHFLKIAFAGAGGFLGWIVGSIVVVLIEGVFEKDFETWVYWTIVVVFIIGFVLFGIYVHDLCLVLATSVGGGYMLVRGLGSIFGKYPDEETLERKVRFGEVGDFPWQWWVYIGLFVFFILSGIVVQCQHMKKKKAEKNEEDDWKKGLMNDYE